MGVSPVLEQAVSGRLFHFALPFLCSMTLWAVRNEKLIVMNGN